MTGPMMDDYIRWLELLGGALAVLGTWIWRVSAKVQGYDAQMKNMDAALTDLQNKRSTNEGRIFSQLEELKISQAVQGTKLSSIEKTCESTNKAILEILSDRMPGGGRRNDPPGGTP